MDTGRDLFLITAWLVSDSSNIYYFYSFEDFIKYIRQSKTCFYDWNVCIGNDPKCLLDYEGNFGLYCEDNNQWLFHL